MSNQQTPHNFNATLDVNGVPTEFRFETMNIKIVNLFQVYFIWDGKIRRFHMQQDKTGQFSITDKHALPANIKISELALAEAILAEHITN